MKRLEKVVWIVVSLLLGAVSGLAAARVEMESRMTRVEVTLEHVSGSLHDMAEIQGLLREDVSAIRAHLEKD